MPYYIRVLGTSSTNIDPDKIIQDLKDRGLFANLEIDTTESKLEWSFIDIHNSNGDVIGVIERNPVIEGELGYDELNEFSETITFSKPLSAVKWLTGYFKKVKVIYAFQLLNSAFKDNNFDIIDSVRNSIWKHAGGILQADGEGFTNEQGSHILWQYPNDVAGNYKMAVKSFFGWTNFLMDLGDINQRRYFSDGKLPKGAKKL